MHDYLQDKDPESADAIQKALDKNNAEVSQAERLLNAVDNIHHKTGMLAELKAKLLHYFSRTDSVDPSEQVGFNEYQYAYNVQLAKAKLLSMVNKEKVNKVNKGDNDQSEIL